MIKIRPYSSFSEVVTTSNNKHIKSEVVNNLQNERSNVTSWNIDKEFARRRELITNAIEAQTGGVLSSKEVVIGKKGFFGKIKLGFESLDSNLKSIYVKYDSIGRRKLLWTLWENTRGNYSSYTEFKESWSPDTNILNK